MFWLLKIKIKNHERAFSNNQIIAHALLNDNIQEEIYTLRILNNTEWREERATSGFAA